MKKGDYLLIILMLCMAALTFGIHFFAGQEQGGTLTVTVDGEIYGVYDLSVDQKVVMDTSAGYNSFEIKEGCVTMLEAGCPDQYCVKHASISKEGETIVCLPHKVVLEITSSDEQREVDA